MSGAARGIGDATVRAFAAAGARVFAIDRDGGAVRATVAALEQPSRNVACEYDLAHIDGLKGLVRSARGLRRKPSVRVLASAYSVVVKGRVESKRDRALARPAVSGVPRVGYRDVMPGA